MTHVARTPAEVRAALDAARRSGLRVGLVPTMGALHEGHLSLVDGARDHGAEMIAVTVFVNPLQFGPAEDLERYPRTLDADLARCRERGVDLVYAPERPTMYPPGFETAVEVGELTTRLEGRFRPGHFRGVTTVVAKLFALASPCVATFGRKDYQQWRVVARMARDLDLDVEVVGMPIVREPDGLALSSRNRYLGPAERERALGIARGLRRAALAFDQGERDRGTLERLAREPVAQGFDRVDYVAIADADDISPLPDEIGERALLAVAAHIGSTRLIDNVVLGEDPAPPCRD